MKICKKCKLEKNLKDFGKKKQNKDGLTGNCKQCINFERSQNLIKLKNENPEKYRNFREKSGKRSKKYKSGPKRELILEKERNWARERYRNNIEYYREKNKTEKAKQCKKNWAINNKEKVKSYQKKWKKRNLERLRNDDEHRKKRAKWSRNYYKMNKIRINNNMKNYLQNPENYKKHLSRGSLNYHVRAGNIKKANHCESCGSNEKLQAHHQDYKKPLDVEWLCSKCHNNLHRLTK